MSPQTDSTLTRVGPTFPSIVCGIDGSRPSKEAARQAALLSDPGAVLAYVAVSSETGVGPTAQATITHKHAREYLRAARDAALELGVDAKLVDEHAADAGPRLLAFSAKQDLLVVGIHSHSRVGGILVGSVATAALHRAHIPVLVARRPPEGVEFPERIVVASDGTPMSDAAVELTARIAARHGSQVGIIGARAHELPFRPGLAEHAAQILEATGDEPVILDAPGAPHHAVAAAARDFNASLVVTGSRDLSGLASLRSASERIAHAAPCSVLVVHR
ncbi:MAG TPA: universal stress protein [Solirubrobacteraceae bacterium]|nr:universal stress protein [Solirubrobacteraceae bacterium]